MNPLKLILASLGITIDQATVDDMMKDGLAAIQAVKEMKASQDRCEAMLKEIMQIRERSFSSTVKTYVDSQGCTRPVSIDPIKIEGVWANTVEKVQS